jgi:hypothetical protein
MASGLKLAECLLFFPTLDIAQAKAHSVPELDAGNPSRLGPIINRLPVDPQHLGNFLGSQSLVFW